MPKELITFNHKYALFDPLKQASIEGGLFRVLIEQLTDDNQYKKDIVELRENIGLNLGNSSKIGAEHIISLL